MAPVRIASSWRTANVDRYERDACVHVSVIETKRILLLPLSVEVCDYVSSDSDWKTRARVTPAPIWI